VTAPYSVGDVVEVKMNRHWWTAEVIELNADGSKVARARVAVSGKLLRFSNSDVTVRRPRVRSALPVRNIEVSEEADSFEAARERSTGSVKAELVAVPKAPKPFRSRAHLKSVAEGGCCVPLCTAPASAHHMENEGGSKKCDDRLTAPLCDVHHLDWWHGKGHLPGLDRTGSLALLWEACARGLAMKMGER
jgi:hypothetical protein